MLLLDSQVALWLVDDSPRLGIAARRRIENDDVVYVSAATIWELTIKSMLGKLEIEPEFESLLVGQGITLLPITAQHAAGISQFPELLRHDPFDRLLVAQARFERLDLLTADRLLLAGGYSFVLDATT
jgi:PIN domain nuclease of toxin-antitoxin system